MQGVNELATAFDLYKAAATWIGGYWGLFNAASLAVVGLVFGGKVSLPVRGKIAIALAYAVFAAANNYALGYAVSVRTAAKETIDASLATLAAAPGASPSPQYVHLISSLDAPSIWTARSFQALLACGLLLGLYAQHRYDTRVSSRAGA